MDSFSLSSQRRAHRRRKKTYPFIIFFWKAKSPWKNKSYIQICAFLKDTITFRMIHFLSCKLYAICKHYQMTNNWITEDFKFKISDPFYLKRTGLLSIKYWTIYLFNYLYIFRMRLGLIVTLLAVCCLAQAVQNVRKDQRRPQLASHRFRYIVFRVEYINKQYKLYICTYIYIICITDK